VKVSLRFVASVPVAAQRTWQRKWRDVLHARQAIVDVYQKEGLDADDFTRRIEQFFKTCHELGDWIEKQTGLPAKAYAKSPPTLELCNAIAQTAKHHQHDRGNDPITAQVDEVFGGADTKHADITWSRQSGPNGRIDALTLADDCIAEWRKFFNEHNLDPDS